MIQSGARAPLVRASRHKRSYSRQSSTATDTPRKGVAELSSKTM